MSRAPVMVLAFDLGLATCGWAGAELTKGETELSNLGVFLTEKSDKKRGVLAADDDLRRARDLAGNMRRLVNSWKPHVLIAERKSLPRNSSSAGKISMAWGIFATIAEEHNLPVVQASPQEVRRFLELPKNASKLDVQAAVVVKNPKVRELLFERGIKKGNEEHPVDATAALYACLESEIVRAVRPR